MLATFQVISIKVFGSVALQRQYVEDIQYLSHSLTSFLRPDGQLARGETR